MMKKDFEYREIPFNYTSFSDKEIILKYFDDATWNTLNELRKHRVTGRSAKLLFEIIGELFIIDRNPYIFNDFLDHKKKQKKLKKIHDMRLEAIGKGAKDDLVFEIITKARKADNDFFAKFRNEKKRRKCILNELGNATSRKNIFFSAFDKVIHVTDATDWRFEYPEVVVYPDTITEIMDLVKNAPVAGLSIIPRGGGTGLTGGAIPVFKNTMVINLEKLRKVGDIETIVENGIAIPIVEAEAGVITDDITHECKKKGFIFATDPTSGWASTIGGNIAENAGGKKAVMWGTAIDNLYSFRLVNPRGDLLEIKRRNHPHRKIYPDDIVIFDVYQIDHKNNLQLSKTITLSGNEIRKKGVGKDITNKALNGLPGLQKEGGDGIIVSAKFVLYRPYQHVNTICLEFFGKNLINASQAIVGIINKFEKHPSVFLTALEHFDEKYVIAINYRNKSDRSDLPKAVLLIDIESDNESELDLSTAAIVDLVKQYNAEGFIAINERTREQFWKDRKNLGAIARHTNAFKLNEDVVIPIESLPLFADFIEKLNITKVLKNNTEIIASIEKYIFSISERDDSFLEMKMQMIVNRLAGFDLKYSKLIDSLDKRASSLPLHGIDSNETRTIFECIREGLIHVDINADIIDHFNQIFHGYDEIISRVSEIIAERRLRTIIVATHMHAGDGNIHVNIPVLSNDYAMMQEADETAGVIMKKTVELGGVISGEHGIGLTKLKFIEQSILDSYAEYKKENDPQDLFNPGKLSSNFPVHMIYTPSLNLLKMEAFILEAADLKDLTASIAACVRCGKCKEVCNTSYPEGNMFYSPRNKILGVSLVTEALLYEAQTAQTLTLKYFKMLREISNHCTMCHNCYSPCPVNIDFGEVTLSMRDLLVERKRASFKPVTALTLYYLRRRGYYINKIYRVLFLKLGYTAQKMGYYLNRPFRKLTSAVVPFIASFLYSKLPAAGDRTIRDVLNLKGTNVFFSFVNPSKAVHKSVIYFPGCGSERMFSEISFAAIALLYNAGVRVVIPPEYLCCGYPILANGKVKIAETKSYENRVIFHRMENLIGYMGIEHVLVTCGTCFEMLQKYQVDNIFPNSSVIDIHEFISREKLFSLSELGNDLVYHDPCHSPLKHAGAEKVFTQITGSVPISIPNCCGEGGTLALSTPHISNTIRQRKRKNISRIIGTNDRMTVLTTCPSCVQGLSKVHNGFSISGKHLIVYCAEKILGKNWKRDFIKSIRKDNGVEKILY